MYRYRDTSMEQEREIRKKNYCKSSGETYDLRQSVVGELVMSPPDKKDPLTSPALRLHGETYIFAVNMEYDLRFAQDGGDRTPSKSDLVKHETLLHNDDARAAGEIQFRSGVVIGINAASGSYNPMQEDLVERDPRFSMALLEAFRRANVQLDATLEEYLRSKAGVS